ncbi:5-oxoprolinase subunit PxpB [Thermoactinomyces mirandus]|nr:5-oxoprolinase subunit PxpB [Thermoactinomyces mirandus]
MPGHTSVELTPLGDTAVMVQLGQTINPETHLKVKKLAIYLDQNPIPGMVEYVPAFTTIAVYYDPLKTSYKKICSILELIVSRSEDLTDPKPRTVEIPVCYAEEFGPDLEFVAKYNGLTPDQVIDIHSSNEYLMYMIGFAPGFPYLGGISKHIATPRRKFPRLSIPAGSVGIAGSQTGVYPISTPGGWQIIGRTPLDLFRPNENPPCLLQVGDLVKFRPICREEYDAWKENAQ